MEPKSKKQQCSVKTVEGRCPNESESKGMCWPHYMRSRRGGDMKLPVKPKGAVKPSGPQPVAPLAIAPASAPSAAAPVLPAEVRRAVAQVCAASGQTEAEFVAALTRDWYERVYKQVVKSAVPGATGT